MYIKSLPHIFIFIVVVFSFIYPCYAVENFFGNPSFETGTFSSWSQSGAGTWHISSTYSYDGTYAAGIHPSGGEGTIKYQYKDTTDIDTIYIWTKVTQCGASDYIQWGFDTDNNKYYGTHDWTLRSFDVSTKPGYHYVSFGIVNYWDAANIHAYFDAAYQDDYEFTSCDVTFEYEGVTSEPAIPYIYYNLSGCTGYPVAHFCLLYYYSWINESWGAKTTATYTDVYPPYATHNSYTISSASGQFFWGGAQYPKITNGKRKFEVTIVNSNTMEIVGNDSYIFDNTYTPPDPPEVPTGTPYPTPSGTPTPAPTPEPPEDPPTGEGANETLNTTWTQGYYNTVNNTVDGFYEPLYNFTNIIVYPVVMLNESLYNFSIQMNESFNTTNTSIGISSNMMFIVINGFPSKVICVIGYYLIWLVILIIFKQDA